MAFPVAFLKVLNMTFEQGTLEEHRTCPWIAHTSLLSVFRMLHVSINVEKGSGLCC